MSSSGGSISRYVGSAPAVIAAVIAVAAAAVVAPVVTGGSGGGSFTCDQTASSSSALTTAISNASAVTPSTICLTSSSSYGTFTGTTKPVTLLAKSGTGGTTTSPTMALTLDSGDGNFTIDGGMARWDDAAGMTISGCTCGNGAHDITLKNFKLFGGADHAFDFTQPPNSNFVIDHAHFYNAVTGEALIYVDHSSCDQTTCPRQSTGITIKNSLFRHFSDDGVKLAGDNATTILNSKFFDFKESNGAANHTDPIQFAEAEGSIVKGNIVYDSDACISGYDGFGGGDIEHNIVWDCNSSAIQTAADTPASTVAWNTVGPTSVGTSDGIQCGNAPGKPAIHSLTNVYDNLTFGGVVLDDGGTTCTPTRNDHNVTGTVTLVGGTNSVANMNSFTTFAQFCVASGAALTAADDGGQVGACGGDYNGSNYGPPEGEGF